jgi:hypothetical protein
MYECICRFRILYIHTVALFTAKELHYCGGCAAHGGVELFDQVLSCGDDWPVFPGVQNRFQ